jgi:hypothetical protein
LPPSPDPAEHTNAAAASKVRTHVFSFLKLLLLPRLRAPFPLLPPSVTLLLLLVLYTLLTPVLCSVTLFTSHTAPVRVQA